MSGLTRCRSCGAAIIFAPTQNGRQVPLDAEGKRLMVLEQDATVPGGRVAVVRVCFTPHFATCPAAAAHRKPKGGAASG
ncbi:MAG TPA: hypothetical protein VFV10_15855 [Gammaproteobacteria bacterium]|nr:hypothetical protein [Gammaproteobacteria bacterium]